ncbi:MAG TPA: 16S rRNA (guanine(966)-N(2))-methyltransferase RsmD [Pseudonocardiaceae bacterium]
MTRIVAGTAGGRRLTVPPRGTRPTSERVREALFNALESLVDLDGLWVLDLYAGSGALGFEALSRGAAEATFVESDRRAVEVLRRNAAALGLPGARVVAGSVEAFVASEPDHRYDVVLADPPYAVSNEALGEVLARLVAGGWLAEDAVLVVERAARDAEPLWPAGITPIRSRRYGDTVTHWAHSLSD